jgi:hypothetical protein
MNVNYLFWSIRLGIVACIILGAILFVIARMTEENLSKEFWLIFTIGVFFIVTFSGYYSLIKGYHKIKK